MPCPTPRWVMSSAIHMTMAVPAVRHSTMKTPSGNVSFGIRSIVSPISPLVVAVERVDQPRALQQGQRHGQVPGGLGDPLLADRALVAPLLELGMTEVSSWMMIELVM